MKTFRPILWILVVAAIALGGQRMWRRKVVKTPDSTKGSGESASGGKPVAPLKVSVVPVVPATFTESVTSTGTLRAEEGIELQAEAGGRVTSINFTEGARVRKGDLLLKLNDGDLQAMLVRATSRLQLAKQREARITRLFKDGIANQDEHETILNDMAVQTAEVAVIRAQIGKTEIRAPFDGVVGLRFISEGAFVNANARIATLQAVDQLKIDFSVPERFAGRISRGTRITFTVAGGERHEGEVVATDPRIDTGTRTLLARAVCPNPEARLRPGSFVSVEVALSKLDNAILVPALAIVPGLTDKNVYIIAEGKAVRRPVETGTRTESVVHVLSGLKSGDLVITSGLQQMRHGLPVEPVTTRIPSVDPSPRTHAQTTSDPRKNVPSAPAPRHATN